MCIRDSYNNFSQLGSKVPLDCNVGETIQSEQVDGSTFFAECLSNDPAIVAYYIQGPNNSYKLYGQGEINSTLSGINTVIGSKSGKSTIEFSNGQKITFTNPLIKIAGILYGDRIMTYTKTQQFHDEKNKIKAIITYGKKEQEDSKLFTWFSSKKENPLAKFESQNDFVQIRIYKYNDQDEDTLIDEGFGIWTSFFQFNNLIYWKYNLQQEQWKTIQKSITLLPSDVTFRKDRQEIINGCLLYTSPSPRDKRQSRMPSSA
eukprot:TRINITY_DN2096_c0_g1_i2.p2 TRINITY_DN2096_c0_g1~~TRINITY_DN2096_c0_g1_i2.p2  ORF type:complete len:260 (+),score=89.74 TRINITY_DN2096_c0_g1_i2:64-843(+)